MVMEDISKTFSSCRCWDISVGINWCSEKTTDRQTDFANINVAKKKQSLSVQFVDISYIVDVWSCWLVL